MNTKRWELVGRHIAKGELEQAVAALDRELSACPFPEFAPLLEEDFTEPPDSVLDYINEHAAKWKHAGELGAVYIEMNGYDINYDAWYFDMFGYEKEGGAGDVEWLCDWTVDTSPDSWVLQGMEESQKFFEWYHENEKYEEDQYEDWYDIALLLVMCKFVRFIGRVLESNRLAVPVPVYATAHEYDIIARFPPR